MRQFSIHKVNKPMMRHKSGGEDDEVDESSGLKQTVGGGADYQGAFEGDYASAAVAGGLSANGRIGDDQPSLLTAEEQEALQPKEIKVVNPWIHEATHKEYLESVKVSTSYLGMRRFERRLSYLNIILNTRILNNLK